MLLSSLNKLLAMNVQFVTENRRNACTDALNILPSSIYIADLQTWK